MNPLLIGLLLAVLGTRQDTGDSSCCNIVEQRTDCCCGGIEPGEGKDCSMDKSKECCECNRIEPREGRKGRDDEEKCDDSEKGTKLLSEAVFLRPVPLPEIIEEQPCDCRK